MKKSLAHGVSEELRSYLQPPRTMVSSLATNGVISVLFFVGSYWLGTYNQRLLPIAAATILLWTLADASICNQFVFDRSRARRALKADGTLQNFLIVKNVAVAILTIPLTILFGLLVVAIVGKWTEILYGVVVAFVLVWWWLGISNALSSLLPFEIIDPKTYLKNRNIWLSYGLLYGLPWILLPAYAVLMGLPFILLGWTRSGTTMQHRVAAVVILAASSIVIWLIGLSIANKYTARPQNKVKRLLQS